MDLEDIMLSEISQIERQILYVFTYMWNLKSKTNEKQQNRNRHTDTKNKLVFTRGARDKGRGKLGEGD